MPNVPHQRTERLALVLGGGGLKGFAHLGVLRALEEHGIVPTMYAGCSIGALVAAARVCGMSVTEITERALRLRRRDLFRINHVGMLLERMRAPSIYMEEPLRALVQSIVPHVRFDEVATPLYVNTVDVERGTQIVWGLPGLRDVYVDDAAYASCALPGFFPPGRVDGRYCVDGGTIDNLPVSMATRRDVDAVIAVDVGNTELGHDATVAAGGFSTVFMRSASVMMHALQNTALTHWSGPPMLLVRPRVAHSNWLNFGVSPEMVDAGYTAAKEALADLDKCLQSPGRIFPRRLVQLSVDQAKCNGCGLCVVTAPDAMALDLQGKAFPRNEVMDWSAADGEFVRHCPTGALDAKTIDPVMEKAS